MSYIFKNEHYEKYPNLKPWIGKKFDNGDTKKLLVIGESHYLPSGSTAASYIEEWYKNEQTSLNDEEKSWINTSGIINKNLSKNFPKKEHWIYRNVAREINKKFFCYSNSAEIFHHIAFMNYFQRPAECQGGSIQVEKIDIEKSEIVVLDVIHTLKPDLVAFCSSKAGKYGKSVIAKEGLKVTVAPHPSCRWWNTQVEKYDGYGRDIIPNFLDKYQWK